MIEKRSLIFADAGATIHATYDPQTQKYTMDFKYYLIDLYDFTIYDELDELNALVIARCYEIYGYTFGSTFWKRKDNKVHYFLFEGEL